MSIANSKQVIKEFRNLLVLAESSSSSISMFNIPRGSRRQSTRSPRQLFLK